MLRSFLWAAVLVAALPLAAQPVALDASFGDGGIAEFSPGTTSAVRDAILLPDGGLVLVGEIDDAAGAVRVTADGALDPAFGTAGAVRFPVEGRDSYLSDVKRLADGGLVVLGAVSTETRDALAYSFVARLGADGALDADFGTGGIVQFDQGNGVADILLAGVEPLPNGSLALAGSGSRTTTDALVVVSARLLADGSRDATYGPDGVVRVGRPISVDDVLRTPSGSLLLSGIDFTTGDAGDAVLLRLQASGALDPAFGTNGVLRASLSDERDAFSQIALDASGRILASGFVELEGSDGADAVVARVTPSGELDPGFGTLGVASSGQGSRAFGSAVAVREDGRVLLAGLLEGPSRPLLAQFLATGEPDASFAEGGLADLDLGGLSAVTLSLLLDDDGGVLLAGYSRPASGGTRMLALRLVETPVAAEDGPEAAAGLALVHAGAHPAARVRLGVELAEAADVRVDLVDVLGRTVARLHDGPLGAGRHEVRAADGLPAGLYVARAVAADGRAVGLPVVVAR